MVKVALLVLVIVVSSCATKKVQENLSVLDKIKSRDLSSSDLKLNCNVYKDRFYYARVYNHPNQNVAGEFLSCDDIGLINNFVNEIEAVLNFSPVHEIGLWVRNEPPFTDSYNPFNLKIEVSIYKGVESVSRAIFYHEFGHYYFTNWILINSTKSEQFKIDLLAKHDFHSIYYGKGLWLKAGEESKLAYEELSEEERAKLSRGFAVTEKINEKLKSVSEGRGYYSKIFLDLTHYNELFADIFAGVLLDEPEVIKKALSHFFQDKDYGPRSLTFYEPTYVDQDPHHSLSNYRKLIYDNFIQINKDKPKQEVLDYLADFFMNEFEYFFEKENIDLDEANSRIKEKFLNPIYL